MSKEEFLKSSGLKVQVLELWVAQEWLIPEETSSGPRFREIDVARARLIGELQSNIGANEAGIDVILHLMDQFRLGAVPNDLEEAFGFAGTDMEGNHVARLIGNPVGVAPDFLCAQRNGRLLIEMLEDNGEILFARDDPLRMVVIEFRCGL
ncbi:MAG: hypothetical protein J0H80_16480 [Rhizobiales bacterium]|nr:hypothetical protein [Hyphomicrobiales bacterium]